MSQKSKDKNLAGEFWSDHAFLSGLIVLAFFLCGYIQTSSDINQTTIPPTSAATSTNENSTYWIKIDPIRDIHLGEIFTITGTTNLPKNDNISFEIYRTSIHCGKNWCTPSYGITGTISVNEGNNGINKISFDVNSSALIPDEFTVMLSAEKLNADTTQLMLILPPRNASVAPVARFAIDAYGN